MKRFMILLWSIFVPMAALANVTNYLTIDLGSKKVTSTNAIAIRETVAVRLINIRASNPTGLVLRVTDAMLTNTFVLSTNFIAAGSITSVQYGVTTVAQTATGSMDLNTSELVSFYSNRAPGFTRPFVVGVWDTLENRLLVNDWLSIMNNPYMPGMPGPDPVGQTFPVLVPGLVPVIGDVLQYLGNGLWSAYAATNILSGGTNHGVWGQVSGVITNQTDLWAELVTLYGGLQIHSNELALVWSELGDRADSNLVWSTFAKTDEVPSTSTVTTIQSDLNSVRSNAVVGVGITTPSGTGSVTRSETSTGVNYQISFPVNAAVTNIGSGLTGNGGSTALAIDTNTVATTGFVASAVAPLLTSTGAAAIYATSTNVVATNQIQDAAIAAKATTQDMAQAQADIEVLQGYTDTVSRLNSSSGEFYRVDNPSGFVSRAEGEASWLGGTSVFSRTATLGVYTQIVFYPGYTIFTYWDTGVVVDEFLKVGPVPGDKLLVLTGAAWTEYSFNSLSNWLVTSGVASDLGPEKVSVYYNAQAAPVYLTPTNMGFAYQFYQTSFSSVDMVWMFMTLKSSVSGSSLNAGTLDSLDSTYFINLANSTGVISAAVITASGIASTGVVGTIQTTIQAQVTANASAISTLNGFTNRSANAADSDTVWTSDFATNYASRLALNILSQYLAEADTTLSTGKVDVAGLLATINALVLTNLSEAAFNNLTGMIVFASSSITSTAIRIGSGGVLGSSRPIDWVHDNGFGSSVTSKLVAAYGGSSGLYDLQFNGNTIWGQHNLSPDQYKTKASYDSEQTNVMKIYSGVVTQNQIGVFGTSWLSDTNLVVSRGGTNWTTYNGVRGP